MKRYLYVDESGQDTRGRLFVVALVLTGADREKAARGLEALEAASGKGAVKWIKTKKDRRAAYLRGLAAARLFGLRACYAVAQDTRNYVGATIEAVAEAIAAEAHAGDTVRVRMDALRKAERIPFGAAVRGRVPRGMRLQFRGVRDEAADPFARLADALAGALRAAEEGREEARSFREWARAAGWLRALP